MGGAVAAGAGRPCPTRRWVGSGRAQPDGTPDDVGLREPQLFEQGGIRAVEIGSVMFAHPDPDTGRIRYPQLELVRLAIPRRLYTQSHLDHVAAALQGIATQRNSMQGFRLS